MDNLSWGRAAVSRYTKSHEEIQADIIRALEGKLSAEFQDYSQWERDAPTPAEDQLPTQQRKSRTKLAKRPVTGTSMTSCSTLCVHPWTKKAAPGVNPSIQIEKQNRIKILENQISTCKNSIDVYKNLKKDLIESNYSYRNEIVECEEKNLSSITHLLEKSEKLALSSSKLTKHSKIAIKEAEEDLEAHRNSAEKSNDGFEADLESVNEKLNRLLHDLQTLRTYKDKEYPVKAMTISRLQAKIASLSIDQKNEQRELERIINTETANLEAQTEEISTNILTKAASNAFNAYVPPSFSTMACRNETLAVEILKHKEYIKVQQKELEDLKNEISSLKKDQKTNMRKHVFPEVFAERPKCHPDEEIVLDIPVNIALPI